jgi:hypothetical protein
MRRRPQKGGGGAEVGVQFRHCPREETRRFGRLSARRAHTNSPYNLDLLWETLWALNRCGRARTELRRQRALVAHLDAVVPRVPVVGRGHASLWTISDTWHSKLVRDIGYRTSCPGRRAARARAAAARRARAAARAAARGRPAGGAAAGR